MDIHKDYLQELEEYFEEHGYDCEKCQKDIEDLRLLVISDQLFVLCTNNK